MGEAHVDGAGQTGGGRNECPFGISIYWYQRTTIIGAKPSRRLRVRVALDFRRAAPHVARGSSGVIRLALLGTTGRLISYPST